MKILLTFLILCLPLSAYSEGLNITGAKVTYITPTTKLTESYEAPTSPSLDDLWRDVDDNVIWKWDGSNWVCKRKTQAIQDEIDIFKANIAGVNDPEVKKCLRALGKVILKIYAEDLE